MQAFLATVVEYVDKKVDSNRIVVSTVYTKSILYSRSSLKPRAHSLQKPFGNHADCCMFFIPTMETQAPQMSWAVSIGSPWNLFL